MDALHILWMVLIIAVVTFLLRLLPFLIFRGGKGTPPWAAYLGAVFPFAIMALLVVYCLKGVDFLKYPYGLPEIIASAAVVVLQVVKKNNLLSILGGTILYMALVQAVFPIS